jgi:GPH family glycoside/pentoside/hexuronide:cation symporter
VGLFVFIGLGILPGLFAKERFYQSAKKQERVPLLRALKEAFQSRPLLALLGLVVFLSVAGNVAAGMAPFIVVYHVYGGLAVEQGGEAAEQAGLVLNAFNGNGFQFVAFAAIPVITWLSGRLGKKEAMLLILALAAIGGVAKWFIYTPRFPYLLLLDPFLSGPIWVAFNMLLPSMMADLCDVDEYEHGKRREGIFAAIYSWIMKFGFSLTFFLSGLAIWASGLNSDSLKDFEHLADPSQREVAMAALQWPLFWMRVFFAGSSVVAMVGGMVCIWFYNVSEKRAYDVRAILEKRRGKLDSTEQ